VACGLMCEGVVVVGLSAIKHMYMVFIMLVRLITLVLLGKMMIKMDDQNS
jgi:hypothetical protein